MANNETLGASFSIDVTDLKAGLNAANRAIRESESEFRAAAAGMDDWTESEDGLNAKIKSLNQITDIQRKKVDALQGEYDRLIADGLDPASKEATELRTKINNETAALNKNEAELKKQTKALEELEDQTEDTGDATDDAGEKFSGLKAAGGIAAGAIAAVGAACVAAVGSLLGLAESTREARTNMAKLKTGFTQAGHSAEAATNTYNELYGVLGDDGQATEAAQHLAQLADTEEDLTKWTKIATGVYATYGDTLPIESLTEAANETAKTGALTGGLADALNWAGVNEEAFQAELDACTTEQERQALITETLNGLYADSADAYRENNAEVIAANEAQARLNETMNELGAIAEPIMTTLKNVAADLLEAITPFVSLIGEGLTGALTGADGAADTLAEGLNGLITTALDKIVEIAPFIIETLLAIIPTLLTELMGQLPSILQTLITMVAQVATALGEMLPTLIPLVIDTLIMLVETLIDNIDLIIDAGIALLLGLADGLIEALPNLIDKIPVIINKLTTAIISNLPKILAAGIEIIVKLGAGLIVAIPKLLANIPQIWAAIIGGIKDGISNIGDVGGDIVEGLWNGIKDMGGWIKDKLAGFGDSVLGSIKDFFGIHSPSRVMADQVGKNLALGIGEGFEDNISEVNKEITDAMNFDDASVNVNASGGGIRGNGVTVYQTNNYKQAYTSRFERYKSQQQLFAAARLMKAGAV
jgi:phage-related protein